jgi:cytoskeletal protein CcmA (bactofilin family)
MARKSHDDALGVAGAETIIGAGVTIHGDLTSDADMIIDGTLEGTITTQGDVTIGVNARIKATLKAGNVVVAETGQVEGDITSTAGLAITPGGVFVGSNHMQVIADFAVAKPDDTHHTPKKPKKA